MRLAMLLFAGLCIGIGMVPATLYGLLPYPVEYLPYTGPHVVQTLQLLLFSGLAFFLMLPFLQRTLTITLDSDWLYRRLLPIGLQWLLATGQPLDAAVRRGASHLVNATIAALTRYHAPRGKLARTWPTGSMVLWVAILLGAYLLAYLFRF